MLCTVGSNLCPWIPSVCFQYLRTFIWFMSMMRSSFCTRTHNQYTLLKRCHLNRSKRCRFQHRDTDTDLCLLFRGSFGGNSAQPEIKKMFDPAVKVYETNQIICDPAVITIWKYLTLIKQHLTKVQKCAQFCLCLFYSISLMTCLSLFSACMRHTL